MAVMDHIDALVIGAGVVGLAVARALAHSGREVIILEREGGIGSGVSSRNSEVIHAGHYYDAGSLKARLCVRGRHLLVAESAQDIATAVLRIVENPAERMRLAAAGRERVLSHHAWPHSMQRLDGIIERCVRQARVSQPSAANALRNSL